MLEIIMKRTISFLLVAIGSLQLSAKEADSQRLTRVVLIRHAEKEAGQNPGLTEAGKRRAEALVGLRKTYKIAKIYSSKYRRTLETVEPLAAALKLKVDSSFGPTHYGEILKDIHKNNDGKTVLVVGHSNTVPGLINFTSPEFKIPYINEDNFSKLFVVEIGKKVNLKHFRYEPSKRGSIKIKPL